MRGSHFQLFIKDISCSLSNRLFSLLKLSSKTAHNPWNRGTKLKDKFNAHQPPLNSFRSLSPLYLLTLLYSQLTGSDPICYLPLSERMSKQDFSKAQVHPFNCFRASSSEMKLCTTLFSFPLLFLNRWVFFFSWFELLFKLFVFAFPCSCRLVSLEWIYTAMDVSRK